MINKIIEKYLGLSFPLKLAVGAIVGVVAGPGLIGFLSEYATYAYALRIGIRPPLEGIPYLSATVTAGSLFLALSASIVFIFARIVAARIAGRIIGLFRDVSVSANKLSTLFDNLFKVRINKTGHDDLINKVKSISPRNALILSISISLLFGAILFAIEYYNKSSTNPFIPGVFGSVFSLVAFLTIWRKAAIWWVAIASAILFYALSFYFIFSINYYSHFLRIVGYGGGSKIDVEYVESAKPPTLSEYYLLLRTSHSLICLETDKSTVTEIPIRTVKAIKYQLGGQHRNFVNVQNIANK